MNKAVAIETKNKIETDQTQIWRDHCRNAVRKFLMSAVVIDNSPALGERSAVPVTTVARAVDDGMSMESGDLDRESEPSETTAELGQVEEFKDGSDERKEIASAGTHITSVEHDGLKRESESLEATGPIDLVDVDDAESHDLYIRKISDAFAQEEMACAFVLPDDREEDEEAINTRITNAAASADIVVIDWYLRDKDPGITLEVLRRIAARDKEENGRLRLICVYTGQPDVEDIAARAREELVKGGLNFSAIPKDEHYARSPHCLVIALNKDAVPEEQLPKKLIETFVDFADGLLPAFALAAVAAVRKNVHHMVTRFTAELDGAYVANRLITNPPGDVADLMRELFVSECDTAIGLDSVADHYLGSETVEAWIATKGMPKSTPAYGEGDGQVDISHAFIKGLVRYGVTDNGMRMPDGAERKFKEQKRDLVSASLHVDKAESQKAERAFSRLVVLKREAFGGTKLGSPESDWRPSLTLGSILELKDGNGEKYEFLHGVRYFYCLTPACDTLRIENETRRFLFLGNTSDSRKVSLVVRDGTGEEQCLFFDPKPSNIFVFQFKGDPVTGRVRALRLGGNQEGRSPTFEYTTEDEKPYKFLWLGEVRPHRAQSDMAELNKNWLRFGIIDSEYLRLAAKGVVKFK